MKIAKKQVEPIQGTTQGHLLVADIKDDIVLTKEGGAALILKTSALNFSLLSEKEQEAIIYAYSAFLNSLTFAIQILVRSRKKDVSNYLKFLKDQEEKQQNAKLKSVMVSYQEFVSQVVKKRNILEKEFYIIIPFSPFELGISATGVLNLISPFKKAGASRKTIPFSKDYVIKKAKTVLYPRRDHLIRQSGRFGLKLAQLTTEDLVRLFFNIYKTGERGLQNDTSIGLS